MITLPLCTWPGEEEGEREREREREEKEGQGGGGKGRKRRDGGRQTEGGREEGRVGE